MKAKFVFESIKDLNPKIISRIKKVKELADRGIRGEKTAAQEKLKLMLKKYNVSLEELENISREPITVPRHKEKYEPDFPRYSMKEYLDRIKRVNDLLDKMSRRDLSNKEKEKLHQDSRYLRRYANFKEYY